MTPHNPIDFRKNVIRPTECYREAWAMIRPQFGLLLAVTLVGMLIGGAVSLVIGAMMCGIYICIFDLQEGRPLKFDRLFQGFQYFLPSLLLLVIVMLPVLVVVAVIYIPLIGLTLAGSRMSEEELIAFLIGTLAIEAVLAVVMVCFHTLLFFSFPLIVDKKLSAFHAIKLSAKAVWGNLGGIAGLFGLGFLVSIIGMLAFCVGVYLVMPLMLAATAVAYRKVFPGRFDTEVGAPPPPSEYKGF